MKRKSLSIILAVVLVIASAIVPMLSLGVAAEEVSATLTFDANKANRISRSTTQQVWQQNGITFTNNKKSSTTNVADYADPVRLYKNSEVIIECSLGNITKIDVECNKSSHVTALVDSITSGASATSSGTVVTITPDSPSSTFTIAALSAATWWHNITVYYQQTSADVNFTVDFSLPASFGTIASVTKSAGSTITLPVASGNSNYTFVGWTTAPLMEDTTQAPNILTGSYTVMNDATLYAVYSYSNSTSDGVYTLVTDASSLKAGDKIIITGAEDNFALGSTQNSNNRSQAEIIKDGNNAVAYDDTQVIVLENGAVAGTFAFNVGNGYLYAAGSSKNNYLRTQTTLDDNGCWKITTADGVTTAVAQGSNTNSTLQYNKSSSLFSAYATASQKAIAIYKENKSVTVTKTFYTTSACDHSTTTTQVTKAATCGTAGELSYICTSCGNVTKVEEIPATNEHNYSTTGNISKEATCTATGTMRYYCTNDGCTKYKSETIPTVDHSYVNGVCSACGTVDVTAMDLTGTYYIAAVRNDNETYRYANTILGGSNRFGIYSTSLNALPSSITSPSAAFAFELEKNDDGTYYIAIAGVAGDAKYIQVGDAVGSTLTVKDDATKLNVTYADGKYTITDPVSTRSFGFNNTSDYAGWYKSSATTAVSLVPVADDAELARVKITAASVVIGDDLSMKYYITLPEGYSIENVKATFSMNKDVQTTNKYETKNGEYIFTYSGIAPQCMGDNIKAEFALSGYVVAILDNYSVRANAAKLLKNADSELATLIYDMLNYGAAAQQYKNYKTNELVNSGYNGGSDDAPTADDDQRKATKPTNEDYQFTAAGVRFDYNNQLYAKFNATDVENLAVKINGVEAKIEKLGEGKYVVYSEGISAVEFGTEFVFELVLDGNVVHKIAYSVNSYAYAMSDDADMSNLAIALYRYGKSAFNYAN